MTTTADEPTEGAEHELSWRTIAEPTSDRADALALVIELWSFKCSITFARGVFEICPRYSPTDEQEARLARHGRVLRDLVLWCVPLYRIREHEDSRAMVSCVAFDRVYPPGWHKGWN